MTLKENHLAGSLYAFIGHAQVARRCVLHRKLMNGNENPPATTLAAFGKPQHYHAPTPCLNQYGPTDRQQASPCVVPWCGCGRSWCHALQTRQVQGSSRHCAAWSPSTAGWLCPVGLFYPHPVPRPPRIDTACIIVVQGQHIAIDMRLMRCVFMIIVCTVKACSRLAVL